MTDQSEFIPLIKTPTVTAHNHRIDDQDVIVCSYQSPPGNVDFSLALLCLKDEFDISRPTSDIQRVFAWRSPVGQLKFKCVNAAGNETPWAPNMLDLFATDWEIHPPKA